VRPFAAANLALIVGVAGALVAMAAAALCRRDMTV